MSKEQTAMQQMYDELMAHEYTIPLGLIVKCKELIEVEKEQIIDACWAGGDDGEQYYNETYGGNK
jgi:hypothetical protein